MAQEHFSSRETIVSEKITAIAIIVLKIGTYW